jgi:2-haloacid dehalogenase
MRANGGAAGAAPDGVPRARAADRRPRVVLIDVFETMLRVDALGERFVDVGRPAHEWELFFTRTLRDGMALTLAGQAPPFGDVARAALRTTVGHVLSDEALDHVLTGFAHLPPGAVPAVVERPHVAAGRMDTVVDRLLGLPA